MKLYKHGKTKDVYALDDGNFLLKFKDTVTGSADGKQDPGGNMVVGEVKGVGRNAILTTVYFFELLKRNKIATHYVGSNPDKNEVTVRPAKMFGEGLEFVYRFTAAGGFVKRFGMYCKDGDPINVFEVTLKDDGRDDPPATKEILSALKLLTEEQYESIKAQTKRICDVIKADLAKKGLELIDIKLEFGNVDGKVMLVDEISGGNMRVFKDGKKLDYNTLSELILKN